MVCSPPPPPSLCSLQSVRGSCSYQASFLVDNPPPRSPLLPTYPNSSPNLQSPYHLFFVAGSSGPPPWPPVAVGGVAATTAQTAVPQPPPAHRCPRQCRRPHHPRDRPLRPLQCCRLDHFRLHHINGGFTLWHQIRIFSPCFSILKILAEVQHGLHLGKMRGGGRAEDLCHHKVARKSPVHRYVKPVKAYLQSATTLLKRKMLGL